MQFCWHWLALVRTLKPTLFCRWLMSPLQSVKRFRGRHQSLKLTNCTWKWMVGILSFWMAHRRSLKRPPYFQFLFRECKYLFFFSIFFFENVIVSKKTSPEFCDVKHDLFLRSWSRVGGCLGRGSGRVSVDTLRWSSHTKTSQNGEKSVVIIILQEHVCF